MARLLILREEADALRSAAFAAAQGHDAVIAPIIETIPTGLRLAPGPAHANLATSRRAIANISPLDLPALRPLPLFVVGAATAEAAVNAGFANIHESAGDAAALARDIIAALAPPGPLLYLAGEPRRPELERDLSGTGFTILPQLLYRMQGASRLPDTAIDALRENSIDAVLHYSQATARLFARLVTAAGLESEAAVPDHLCLSAPVAKGLTDLPGLRLKHAETPREAALLALAID